MASRWKKTAYLEDVTAARVQVVFDRHNALFEEKKGISNVAEHVIKLSEWAAPKRGHHYRITKV